MIERFLNSYKPLIAIPVIITLIALVIILTQGLNEGIDLKGGTIVNLELNSPTSSADLQNIIASGLGIDTKLVNVKTNTGTEATVEISSSTDIIRLTEILSGTATILSYREVGPLLGKQALQQVYYAIAFAFLFMSITVFIIFRNFVPSIAVILAALSDIIIAVAGMSVFGIPFSIASVGAILMLIGYSVDTDILLTTRVLKRREGTVNERAIDAMKTGLTMAAAAIGSMVTLYLVVHFLIPQASSLAEIAAVLIMGLAADVITTWLMNLGILRWYLEGRR